MSVIAIKSGYPKTETTTGLTLSEKSDRAVPRTLGLLTSINLLDRLRNTQDVIRQQYATGAYITRNAVELVITSENTGTDIDDEHIALLL